MNRAILFWSGGKDAAWSLVQTRDRFEVAALVTTVGESDHSVPIHNIPHSMIAAQAEALSLPLWTIPIPQPCSNAEYTARLQSAWELAARGRIEWVIFGDLFLADIRAWREQLLSAVPLTPVFPLWMQPTRELAREMIHGGLHATVCAVDETRLPATLVGQNFDEEFLSALPDGIDPCGENGEFHTFVRHMPGFSSTIECAVSSL